MNRKELQTAIIEVIQNTLEEKGVQTPAITLETPVDGTLGLDSLDWAVVVVKLENAIKIDPFRNGISRQLQTVSDLVDLYQSAVDST